MLQLQDAVPLLAIFVVIYTMYKTAEENRISKIHEEMYLSLVEIVSIFNEILSLLDDIANKVFYRTVAEHSLKETAYDRYWRKIEGLSERFKAIQDRQRLCVPKVLCKDVQNIVDNLNKARNLATIAPTEEYGYPDTSELRSVVDMAKKNLQNFISRSRKYLGTDRMKALIGTDQVYLAGEDTNKKI